MHRLREFCTGEHDLAFGILERTSDFKGGQSPVHQDDGADFVGAEQNLEPPTEVLAQDGDGDAGPIPRFCKPLAARLSATSSCSQVVVCAPLMFVIEPGRGPRWVSVAA
jgi:hypothetical protein